MPSAPGPASGCRRFRPSLPPFRVSSFSISGFLCPGHCLCHVAVSVANLAVHLAMPPPNNLLLFHLLRFEGVLLAKASPTGAGRNLSYDRRIPIGDRKEFMHRIRLLIEEINRCAIFSNDVHIHVYKMGPPCGSGP